MTTLKTALGFGVSDKAQFRFHVLQVCYQSGWKGVKNDQADPLSLEEDLREFQQEA